MPDIDEQIETIRVILPTPPVVKIQINPVNIVNVQTSPLYIGAYARLVAISGGPPNGVKLEVFDGVDWVEQWRWTE